MTSMYLLLLSGLPRPGRCQPVRPQRRELLHSGGATLPVQVVVKFNSGNDEKNKERNSNFPTISTHSIKTTTRFSELRH